MPEFEHITVEGVVVGVKDSQELHEGHLLHRSVHVLLMDVSGNIFLRQRPENKKLYPGVWTSAVGAHVALGQTPGKAAKENLQSFLGVTSSLMFLGVHHVEDAYENELAYFYLVITDKVPLKNPEQSMDQGFKTVDEIAQLVREGLTTPYVEAGLLLYQEYRMRQN